MPDYVIIQPRADAGFFSTMDDALAILQHFDAGHPLGVTFDFGQLGLYYDPAHSANWWEYYFKPMRLGDTSSKAQIIYLYDYMPFITHRMSRDEANKFIHKYIHIRPEINEKVNDFVTKNFANHFVIGVHYRGTDKVTEVPLVSYQVVAQRLASEIAALKRADYRVFVATDELGFLNFMLSQFPNRVVFLPGVSRSSNEDPVHFNQNNSGYKLGEDALMDCVLLSKTNLLIRTDSNLSRWSGYFNPQLRVILVDSK